MIETNAGRAGVSCLLMGVVAAALLAFAGVAAASAGAVAFPADEATLWERRTQVVAFEVDPAADEDRVFDVVATPADRVEVVRRAEVLAGHRIGFLRVEALSPGPATIEVAGATLRVNIEPSPVPPDAADTRPRLTTPVDGAAVWGELCVAVEAPPRWAESVELSLPAGASVIDRRVQAGAPALVSFIVDFAGAEAGPATLGVSWPDADAASRAAASIGVRVVDAASAGVRVIEAEDAVDPAVRPERYGDREKKPREDDAASGGAFTPHAGANPPVAFPLVVDEPGRYQLVVRAGGDFGGGAWPTVGLRVNDANEPRTAGRLARGDWHRVAVGRPIRLEPGEHVLIPYFENDFHRHRLTDRNLRLDRCELVRLDAAPPADAPLADDPFDHPVALVATSPTLHGRALQGDQRVEVRVWRAGHGPDATPPAVDLVLNGEVVATQRSGRAPFHLDRAHFRDGDNALAAVARFDDGRTARSAEQRFRVAAAGGELGEPSRYARFDARDPAWIDGAKNRLREDGPGRRRVVAFMSNGAATLAVPDAMAGRFRVRLEGKGSAYEGPPVAKLFLATDDAERLLAEEPIHGGWRSYELGEVELPPGPKRIKLAFTNDHYGGSAKKDRNLWMGALTFTDADAEDRPDLAPTIAIRYPAAGRRVSVVDAVVVDVGDDRGVRWVELEVDGEPTGLRVEPRQGDARVLIPWPLTGVPAGEREITVRVHDGGDRAVRSEPRRVVVASSPEEADDGYARAVRLLDRFAFGPEPGELAEALVVGERAYLEARLAAEPDAGVRNAWALARLSYPGDGSNYHVARRGVEFLTLTPNPARARFTTFVDNHFSTWIRKTGAPLEAAEQARFLALGPAPFGDLLRASATSPAMLRYLDQQQSFVGRLNENYAREIMELHTLGVDAGYTQDDVTALARLLTGWTSMREASPRPGAALADAFRYAPSLASPGPQRVFGVAFDAAETPRTRRDRVDRVLETLAAHPATARHLATKLAAYYADRGDDAALVDALAETFLGSGGDTAAVLLALAEAERDGLAASPSRLAHPLGYAVRLCRVTGRRRGGDVMKYLQLSGFGYYDRETPDGYPLDDASYADTNAMLQRWRLAQRFEWALQAMIPAPMREPPAADDAAGAVADDARERWRERVVDTLAVRLTGRPLGERSRGAVLDAFARSDLGSGDWRRAVATLVAQMPEAHTR